MPLTITKTQDDIAPGFRHDAENGDVFHLWPPPGPSHRWMADKRTGALATGETATGAMLTAHFPKAIREAFQETLTREGIKP